MLCASVVHRFSSHVILAFYKVNETRQTRLRTTKMCARETRLTQCLKSFSSRIARENDYSKLEAESSFYLVGFQQCNVENSESFHFNESIAIARLYYSLFSNVNLP